MAIKFETSHRRLRDALKKLEQVIEHMSTQQKEMADDSKLSYLEQLNCGLKQENLMLKEQLFSTISNMNNLKNKNKKISSDIDEAVMALEKLLSS